jgi:transposase
MAMGTRQSEQASLWVATAELPESPGHPFYTRLNALLDADDFDRFVEGQCARILCTGDGTAEPGAGALLPVAADRLLRRPRRRTRHRLARARFACAPQFPAAGVGRGVARSFDDLPTRRVIDLERHRAVFTWVQQRLVAAGLLKGKTVAVDATMLEANAAMRSIVRRDTGKNYQAFLSGLARGTRSAKDSSGPFDGSVSIG